MREGEKTLIAVFFIIAAIICEIFAQRVDNTGTPLDANQVYRNLISRERYHSAAMVLMLLCLNCQLLLRSF